MNHFELIIKEIRERENAFYDAKTSASYSILRHLIELMGEDKFNRLFNNYFINFRLSSLSFEASFYQFHKSMRVNDFYEIGEGHLDMIFWHYIQISNKCFDVFKKHYDFIMPRLDEIKVLSENIGKKVEKCSIGRQEENGKPFKSGSITNTVKSIIIHPILEVFAYTFEEDDSYVECRRCKVVEQIN